MYMYETISVRYKGIERREKDEDWYLCESCLSTGAKRMYEST